MSRLHQPVARRLTWSPDVRLPSTPPAPPTPPPSPPVPTPPLTEEELNEQYRAWADADAIEEALEDNYVFEPVE